MVNAPKFFCNSALPSVEPMALIDVVVLSASPFNTVISKSIFGLAPVDKGRVILTLEIGSILNCAAINF